MTDAWTEKQLAQFVRVRDGFIKTGFPHDVASAHAASTIEQSRRRPKKAEPDPTNPTKDDLYREAMRYNITGRSKMDKDQLANAVHGHRMTGRHQ
jgi:hypothetical protein